MLLFVLLQLIYTIRKSFINGQYFICLNVTMVSLSFVLIVLLMPDSSNNPYISHFLEQETHYKNINGNITNRIPSLISSERDQYEAQLKHNKSVSKLQHYISQSDIDEEQKYVTLRRKHPLNVFNRLFNNSSVETDTKHRPIQQNPHESHSVLETETGSHKEEAHNKGNIQEKYTTHVAKSIDYKDKQFRQDVDLVYSTVKSTTLNGNHANTLVPEQKGSSRYLDKESSSMQQENISLERQQESTHQQQRTSLERQDKHDINNPLKAEIDSAQRQGIKTPLERELDSRQQEERNMHLQRIPEGVQLQDINKPLNR